MLISTWSQKGSCGKTTTACQAVKFFGAKPLDLDDLNCHDLAKWAATAGIECQTASAEAARELLKQASADESQLWWADCRPGDIPRSNLFGIAYAQIVVIPVRGGGDQDLAQLGRCAGVIKQIREGGNPELKMAVLFTAARETSRDKAAEKAVRSWCVATGETFLGTTKLREAYPDAYSRGTSVMALGGPAAEEMQAILTSLARLIPAHLLVNSPATVQAA